MGEKLTQSTSVIFEGDSIKPTVITSRTEHKIQPDPDNPLINYIQNGGELPQTTSVLDLALGNRYANQVTRDPSLTYTPEGLAIIMRAHEILGAIPK